MLIGVRWFNCPALRWQTVEKFIAFEAIHLRRRRYEMKRRATVCCVRRQLIAPAGAAAAGSDYERCINSVATFASGFTYHSLYNSTTHLGTYSDHTRRLLACIIVSVYDCMGVEFTGTAEKCSGNPCANGAKVSFCVRTICSRLK